VMAPVTILSALLLLAADMIAPLTTPPIKAFFYGSTGKREREIN
jgi:hypothetical protein